MNQASRGGKRNNNNSFNNGARWVYYWAVYQPPAYKVQETELENP